MVDKISTRASSKALMFNALGRGVIDGKLCSLAVSSIWSAGGGAMVISFTVQVIHKNRVGMQF